MLNSDNKMHGMGIITAVTKGKFTQIDVQQKLISNEENKCTSLLQRK